VAGPLETASLHYSRKEKTMKTGDTVKFRNPLPDEIGMTYTVIEVNGDRCVIEANTGMTFNPQQVAKVTDLEVIKST
jgi:hypothetical protein